MCVACCVMRDGTQFDRAVRRLARDWSASDTRRVDDDDDDNNDRNNGDAVATRSLLEIAYRRASMRTAAAMLVVLQRFETMPSDVIAQVCVFAGDRASHWGCVSVCRRWTR
jgi:hypothetical protein